MSKKEKPRRPALCALFLLAVYLFGLALGSCAVGVYPIYYKQKNYFLSKAREIAREFPEGGEETLNFISGANMRILIYNARGNRLRYVTPWSSHSSEEPVIPMEKPLRAVLAGREVYRPAVANETQRYLTDIMVVTGTPIRDGERVTGAVFLIKNLMDLPEAIAGFCVYFTIFYWICAGLIVSNLRKRRKLDRLQRNYIANVTHAFKTPIASIKALAETLCDGVEPDPDRQRVYYGMILQQANQQDHMVRDVLELSKLQSSGMDFTRSKAALPEILAPVLEKYATLCDCMGIALHVSEELARLPPLYTNAACVRQLLELLLDNAVKFAGEGGGIWLEAAWTRNRAALCVRDDGPGIAREDQAHIFERFYKCPRDGNEGGSGLGLAIAREIAGGLKEKLWVESEPGRGAAFFFTVRLSR